MWLEMEMCSCERVMYTNWTLTYTTKQGSRVGWVAQTGFAAFGKAVQLISGSPYDETLPSETLPPHDDK